ncbi:hypothetical protein, partial [Amycolatopsis sp. KNN50.9b]|uniref:hypothetical protein n=1 Tax=Amycolatopsis sp. KNN50.9b TaxID=2018303 RepID=UPI0018E9C718
ASTSSRPCSTSSSAARPRPPPPPAGHAAVRFVTSPRTGRLTSLSRLPEQGPGVPFVRWRAAVGDLVHAARTNTDRLGSFVVTGSDADEVEERADALGRQIRIQVTPLPAAGGPGQVRPARTAAGQQLDAGRRVGPRIRRRRRSRFPSSGRRR